MGFPNSGKGFFSPPELPDRFWVPFSLMFKWYRSFFPAGAEVGAQKSMVFDMRGAKSQLHIFIACTKATLVYCNPGYILETWPLSCIIRVAFLMLHTLWRPNSIHYTRNRLNVGFVTLWVTLLVSQRNGNFTFTLHVTWKIILLLSYTDNIILCLSYKWHARQFYDYLTLISKIILPSSYTSHVR